MKIIIYNFFFVNYYYYFFLKGTPGGGVIPSPNIFWKAQAPEAKPVIPPTNHFPFWVDIKILVRGDAAFGHHTSLFAFKREAPAYFGDTPITPAWIPVQKQPLKRKTALPSSSYPLALLPKEFLEKLLLHRLQKFQVKKYRKRTTLGRLIHSLPQKKANNH